ncbi:trehalose-phosphatase, partial [candidate division KSB1 bacterium]
MNRKVVLKDLFEYLTLVKNEINRHSILFLCLDYDGTLIPIKDHPAKAIIDNEKRKIIRSISGKNDVKIIIATGRSYEDIYNIIKVDGIYYISNHGFKINGPDLSEEFVEPGWEIRLREMCKEIEKKLSCFEGVWIEFKKLTASLHYRMAYKSEVNDIKKTFFETLKNYVDYNIIEGKMVYEITNFSGWNKGKAILFILKHLFGNLWKKKVFIIYIGDDNTD